MLKTNIKETFLELEKKFWFEKALCAWEFWPQMTNNKIHSNKITRFERKGKNAVDVSAKTAGGL